MWKSFKKLDHMRGEIIANKKNSTWESGWLCCDNARTRFGWQYIFIICWNLKSRCLVLGEKDYSFADAVQSTGIYGLYEHYQAEFNFMTHEIVLKVKELKQRNFHFLASNGPYRVWKKCTTTNNCEVIDLV